MKNRRAIFLILVLFFAGICFCEKIFGEDTSAQTPGLADKVVENIRSRIQASGRKMAEIRYSQSWFLNPPAGITYSPEATGFSMAQELQFRLAGKVGEKITVSIEYDDTQKKKQKISVIYTGESREVIQDVNFGDITLSLPGTEFVAYNKQLFGLSVRGQIQKFGFTFIGSQSKGYSETKEFTGKSASTVKDILDTSFSRLKYYTFRRHINSGKEKIYIDDKNSSNNTPNNRHIEFLDVLLGTNVIGDFEPQYSGVDYTINYGVTSSDTTIISFTRSIESNFVIIVYNVENGETFVIKNDINSDTLVDRYELQNYYYLGNRNIVPKEQDRNFILEVRNLDNSVDGNIAIAPTSEIAKYYAVIDYDFGTIRFTDASGKQDIEPFYSSAYLQSSPVHTFSIHGEYKSKIKIFLLQPNMVEESEKVYLDGRLLTRDLDYTIDYESGFISFVREDSIKEESNIKIDYEYMPFGGQYVETVVGFRGTLPISSDFSIGSTYLYSGTPSPEEIPSIRSTPKSHQIIDVDASMNPLSLISRLFPFAYYAPFTTNLSGEYAYSWKNPNTFGKAMIDDMEGIKVSADMPVDMYSWKISSILNSETQSARGNYSLENKSEGHDPNSTSQNSLLINYTLQDSQWIAICYPISKYSQDFSQYNAVEFWVKNPPANIDFYMDFGIISEDVDGRGGFASDTGVWKSGQPKTEDINGDGKLNSGEDVGWIFYDANGNPSRIGAGNNRLDGEDLDGDGQLNVTEKIHTFGGSFSSLDASYLVSTSGEWKLYRIPFAQAVSGDTDWTMVKHLRLRVKNTSGSAQNNKIQFDYMSIVGNKWSNILISGVLGVNTFSIEARNTKDNPDYASHAFRDYVPSSDYDVDGDGINDYFEELHPNFESQIAGLTKEQWPKEQSMALVYSFNGPCDASTTQKFTRAMNFTEYGALKFWVYPTENSSGSTLLFRFGMDDTTGFEYRAPITSSMEQKWTLVELDIRSLDNLQRIGSSTIENREILYSVKQITIGISSDTGSGGIKKEIWIDELHLDSVEVKEGSAWKVGFSTSIADGFINAGYSKKQMSHKFETVGVASPSEDYDYENINGTILVSKLMPQEWGVSLPVGAGWTRTRSYLEPSSAPEVSQSKLGERSNESQNYNLQFSKAYLPSISGTYSKSNLLSNFKGAQQYEIDQVFSGSLDYSYVFPEKIFYVVPTGNRLSTALRYSIGGDKRETKPSLEAETTTFIQNQTHDFSISAASQPIQEISLSPSYSRRYSLQEYAYNHDLENIFKPIVKNQALQLVSSTSLIPGISPGVTLGEDLGENFFSNVSSQLRKNANAHAVINISANISPEKWYEPLKFFNFYNVFSLDVNASYEDLDDTISLGDFTMDIFKLFKDIRDNESPLSASRKTSSSRKTYSLNSNIYIWDPLSTNASLSWGLDETQNRGSFLQTNNFTYGTNARLDLNQAFPNMKRPYESSNIVGSFSHRISETMNVSKSQNINPSFGWQILWNSMLNQYLSMNYSYDIEEKSAYLKTISVLSPGFKTDYYYNFPISIKLPFFKEIVLPNRLDISNNNGAEFKHVKDGNIVERTNKLNSSLGVTYNVAENLQTTFSFSFSYFNNVDDYTKDYIAISFALSGVIRF